MDQDFSWEANSYPFRKFSAFYGKQMFIRVLKEPATGPCTEPYESSTQPPNQLLQDPFKYYSLIRL
jgi:hypothetical protein